MEDVIVCGECKGTRRVHDVGGWVRCHVCNGTPVVAVEEIAVQPVTEAEEVAADAEPQSDDSAHPDAGGGDASHEG